jgi:2,3-dihydroxybenzoate-AMP ligase
VPWPDDLAERYRAAGFWPRTTLGQLPAEWARAHGDRVALIYVEERVTFVGLSERVDALARALVGHGLQPGDRVVVQLPNHPHCVYLTLALLRMNALPVMALPAHREHELSYMVDHTGAVAYAAPDTHRGFDHRELAAALQDRCPTLTHVIVSGEADREDQLTVASLLAESWPDIDLPAGDPEEVSLFLLSGGTTGLPKLIPRTNTDYVYNFRRSAEVCQFDADTRYLVALPVSHNFPLACPGILGTMEAGGSVVLLPSPQPASAFAAIAEHGVTCTAVVPAVALGWMDSELLPAADLSTLKLLQVGGARLNPEAATRIFRELHCTPQQVFGMAEGLLNYTDPDDSEDVIVHTQGRPMSPGDEIRIVDGEGNDVPTGAQGELLTRGPYTLRGYYRAEEHNRRAFTETGFYRTGDVVRLHPSGCLVVEGREKDLINRGGEKISAEELETLILAHPAVRNVAVVAMPDRVLGERICAFVMLTPGAQVELPELVAFLEERKLARYKLPERLEAIDALPLTKIGKVAKNELRAQIAAVLDRERAEAATE